jgi:AdoMet-dependent heme synthase
MVSPPLAWVSIPHLDDLWFQVGGTLCNLTCHHCFISCSPKNRSFGFLSLDEVKRRLEESVALGVKEYYFTGGEPFLNPEMTDILCETLRYGPATVLTNGTVLKDAWLERLRAAEEASLYSLEFRVSIDGFSPQTNDPIRGIGTFERAMEGVEKLVEHGFLPIITAARTWPIEKDHQVVGEFVEMLKAHRISSRHTPCAVASPDGTRSVPTTYWDRPRLKILPTLHIGAEQQRTHGYHDDERVTPQMLDGYDRSQLVCQHSRIVTDRGIQVCPILIESADSILGQSLEESLRPYAIQHGACWTCYQFGAICSNPSSVAVRGDAR